MNRAWPLRHGGVAAPRTRAGGGAGGGVPGVVGAGHGAYLVPTPW